MPPKNHDLHGNAPDQSPVALVLVDVINDLEFPGAEEMAESAVAAAERIAALKRRAREAGIPVVYANDNFGRWRSDFRDVTEHVLEDGVRGEPLARLLRPEPDDYFVLKPKHSAFFATTLDTLLQYLGVHTLVLAGVSGDVCVLFTASDAYMRDFDLYVPEDCTASVSAEENRRALAYMRRVFGADTTPSTELDLRALRREEDDGDA
jgi:nicotinamidase-related amidase